MTSKKTCVSSSIINWDRCPDRSCPRPRRFGKIIPSRANMTHFKSIVWQHHSQIKTFWSVLISNFNKPACSLSGNNGAEIFIYKTINRKWKYRKKFIWQDGGNNLLTTVKFKIFTLQSTDKPFKIVSLIAASR